MASFLAAASNLAACPKSKNGLQTKPIGQMVPVILLLLAICGSGIFYIFQVNRLATMGYEIRQQEKAVQELVKSNESLKIKAAELRSMTELEEKKDELRLVKPEEVSYIEVQNPVALR